MDKRRTQKCITIFLLIAMILGLCSCTNQTEIAKKSNGGTANALPECPTKDKARYALFKGVWLDKEGNVSMELPNKQPENSYFYTDDTNSFLTLRVTSGNYYGTYTVVQLDQNYENHWCIMYYAANLNSLYVGKDAHITTDIITQELIDKAKSGASLSKEEISILRNGKFSLEDFTEIDFTEHWRDEHALDFSQYYYESQSSDDAETEEIARARASCADLYARCAEMDSRIRSNLKRLYLVIEAANEAGNDVSYSSYHSYEKDYNAWVEEDYGSYYDRNILADLILEAETLNKAVVTEGNKVAAKIGVNSIGKYSYN